jgi:hypothetical protein
MVTPKDQIIKAIGDLSSVLHHRDNIRGKEEMAVLQKMNDILNNTTTVPAEKKKECHLQGPHTRTKGGAKRGQFAAITQDCTSSKGGHSHRQQTTMHSSHQWTNNPFQIYPSSGQHCQQRTVNAKSTAT